MNDRYDVAVVGAGIVGLAHAWVAARDGAKVVLLERDPRARGASVRNFGMIWPIGQPAGAARDLALTSRRLWCEVAEAAGLWSRECGSIHLAHRDDEWNVLEEFAAQADTAGYDCRLLTADEVLKRTDGANPQDLRGGLWSPTEICVDPREAVRVLPEYLRDRLGVDVRFATPVRRISAPELETADGTTWRADQIFVAGGSDLETLFPDVLSQAGLQRCKLQMMRTAVQPGGWRIGPHLASGLTLRHYGNFHACRTLDKLKQRIAFETPELDRWGIHVMVAQNGRGEVVLGDSHEYNDVEEPFCRDEIDALILRELHKIARLPTWAIAERWYGVYAKHPNLPYVQFAPQPGVRIVTGLGGAGMTLAFGVASEMWQRTRR